MRNKIDKLRRFQEVVCFLTVKKYLESFKSMMDYDLADALTKAYHLSISPKILQALSLVDGVHCLNKLAEQSSHLFTYHKHYHAGIPKPKPADGSNAKKSSRKKKFSKNAWFELNRDVLKKWLSDKDNLNIKKCTLICEDSKKFLEEKAFAPLKKEKNMTKAREKEIRRECAEGKHGCSAEYLIKEEKKAERRAEKAAQRRMDKSNAALVEALARIEQLTQENAELRAELKAQAEREVPDDSVSYVLDEQDKAVVEACEAVDGTKLDEGQCTATLKMIADLGTPKAQEPKKPTPAEVAREKSNEEAHFNAVNAKNRLQTLVNDEVMDASDAKLIGRVMYGRDFKLKEGPHGWSVILAEKNAEYRAKIFDALVMRIKRQEYFNAKKEDVERVMRLSRSYASMVNAIEARRRQEAVQQSIARAQVKQAQAQTPPPIAVPKPQLPFVTDENAASVLEDIGL